MAKRGRKPAKKVEPVVEKPRIVPELKDARPGMFSIKDHEDRIYLLECLVEELLEAKNDPKSEGKGPDEVPGDNPSDR